MIKFDECEYQNQILELRFSVNFHYFDRLGSFLNTIFKVFPNLEVQSIGAEGVQIICSTENLLIAIAPTSYIATTDQRPNKQTIQKIAIPVFYELASFMEIMLITRIGNRHILFKGEKSIEEAARKIIDFGIIDSSSKIMENFDNKEPEVSFGISFRNKGVRQKILIASQTRKINIPPIMPKGVKVDFGKFKKTGISFDFDYSILADLRVKDTDLEKFIDSNFVMTKKAPFFQ